MVSYQTIGDHQKYSTNDYGHISPEADFPISGNVNLVGISRIVNHHDFTAQSQCVGTANLRPVLPTGSGAVHKRHPTMSILVIPGVRDRSHYLRPRAERTSA